MTCYMLLLLDASVPLPQRLWEVWDAAEGLLFAVYNYSWMSVYFVKKDADE